MVRSKGNNPNSFHANYLTDSTGFLAVLINCRQVDDKLMCGVALFKGGLHGTIQVGVNNNDGAFGAADLGKNFLVKVPESVATNATYQVFADIKDNLEIDICYQ
jgi:hypothetical protein